MIVLINPHAGGDAAMRKWNSVEPTLRNYGNTFRMHILNGQGTMKQLVLDALHCGETDFVAAGGDGTVNDLLNVIIETATPEQLQGIRLGAIGLGSSNDFHKPQTGSTLISGIPFKMNFGSVQSRDVGCVKLGTEGHCITRYFLNNASVGVTAEANARFNAPDRPLEYLKRFHTASAILATTLRTIATFKNIDMTLIHGDQTRRRIRLTNLAFIKNPHFAGTLSYNVPFSFDDGCLQLVLCEDMSRLGLLRLLTALQSKSHGKQPGIESWKSNSIIIKSREQFAVEFDGEVVVTRNAHFCVLPRHLKVCTC
jgi:diacylglycerol kinase (ATP)